jgi:hypothetical protein
MMRRVVFKTDPSPFPPIDLNLEIESGHFATLLLAVGSSIVVE